MESSTVVEFSGATYVLQSHAYMLKEYGAGTGPVSYLQVGDVVSLDADEKASRLAGDFLILSIRTYEFGGDMVDQNGTIVDIVDEEGTGWTLALDRVSQFLQKKEDGSGDTC